MQFGICTSPENSASAKAAGWDFVEGSTQSLFQGTLGDSAYTGGEGFAKSALPIPVTNVMVPADLKITGPSADPVKLQAYMTNVCRRARQHGTKIIIFGSGGARNVPDGFDRNTAKRQITDFLKMIAPIAQQNNVTLGIEHLNKKECNIINTVAEAMEYVRAANHPNIQCMVDSWHLWLEDEPLANVKDAMHAIKHVHVADLEGRFPPGESGKSDFVPLFRVLKQAGYDARISVEASKFDIPQMGSRVLKFLKDQWGKA